MTWGLLALILARVEPVDWLTGVWTVLAAWCLIASFVLYRRERRRREAVTPER